MLVPSGCFSIAFLLVVSSRVVVLASADTKAIHVSFADTSMVPLPHFWRSCGWCPPEPHASFNSYFLTEDQRQNHIYIGECAVALPGRHSRGTELPKREINETKRRTTKRTAAQQKTERHGRGKESVKDLKSNCSVEQRISMRKPRRKWTWRKSTSAERKTGGEKKQPVCGDETRVETCSAK